MLITLPIQIQSSWQLSLLELPPCYRNNVTPSSVCSNMYTSTVQSGPLLLMLHSRPALVSKPLILLLPILHLLPLPPRQRPLLLVVIIRLLFPLFPLTLSAFFNGMLEVSEPEAPNYFTFSRPILSTLSASRNPILILFPLSRFLDSLFCVLIEPTSGLAFSLMMLVASGGVVIFVRQGQSFSKLSTSSLSLFDPYPDYVGVNISPNYSSSVSFLMSTLPLFAFFQRIAEPTSFLAPFFPLEMSSFWGTSIAITPSGTQEVLPTPAGRKYLTG